MFRQKYVMIMLLLMFSAAAFSQEKMTMDLWPKGAVLPSPDKEDKAELTVYLPEAKKATGRAVVCCPGGGYTHLAMDHEGHQWATFFNNQGIALIVLKYRMPHGNPQIPVSDAEQAMKTVRMNATEWHIDRNDVGIMGFSAGGHLASTIATRSSRWIWDIPTRGLMTTCSVRLRSRKRNRRRCAAWSSSIATTCR